MWTVMVTLAALAGTGAVLWYFSATLVGGFFSDPQYFWVMGATVIAAAVLLLLFEWGVRRVLQAELQTNAVYVAQAITATTTLSGQVQALAVQLAAIQQELTTGNRRFDSLNGRIEAIESTLRLHDAELEQIHKSRQPRDPPG